MSSLGSSCRVPRAVGGFTFQATSVIGVVVVEARAFDDERGSFSETYRANAFAQAGIAASFVQDNQSVSKRGVVRGLHAQGKRPQAKLVRVGFGAVFDVAVDLRPDSPTFGRWAGALLTAENARQLFVPRGCAHGFMALADGSLVLYRADDYFEPGDEAGVRWDDAAIGIAWPQVERVLVNDRDRALPTLAERLSQHRGARAAMPCGPASQAGRG